MALDEQDIELDASLLDDVIPGLVFTAAVEAHWIPAPPAPTSPEIVPLADPYDTYYVEAAYRQQFLGLMAEATDFWKGEAAADKRRDATVPKPVRKSPASGPQATGKRTPADWIDWYLNSKNKGLKMIDLVEAARKERSARSMAGVSASSVTRIYRGHFVGRDIRIAVASVIGCDPDDLLWDRTKLTRQTATRKSPRRTVKFGARK
jgi:hypothetical protein